MFLRWSTGGLIWDSAIRELVPCALCLWKSVVFFFTDITLLDAELLHGCFYHSIVSELVRALVAWACHFLVFSNRLGLGFDIELHSVAGLWECLWQSTLE